MIGYLRPDPRLNDRPFRIELEKCIEARRSNIQLALKVDSVKIIMYQNYSLDQSACLWESKEYKLAQEPELQNLIDIVTEMIKERKLLIEQEEEKAV